VSVAVLEEVYASRPDTVRALADAGRPVLGVVGADVPVELVTASGALSYRLHGSPDRVTDEAHEVLGASLDPVAHSILSQLLDGSLAFLTGVVVSRDSQASLQLFYALRELRRLEPHRPIPPVVLLDLLHLPTVHTARYDEARLHRLADELAGWTGVAPTAHRLAEASAVVGRVRTLLRRVSDLRRGPRPVLTGTQVLRVLGATTALPPEDAVPLLEQVLADAAGGALVPAGRRVFLTGSAQDTDEVHRALEEADCLVVGEDSDWGDLALTVEPDGADLASLAVAYRDRGPAAATAPIERRAAWTAEQVRRCAADVLLAVVREHDEAPAWDFPAQAAAAGVPAALLARQPYRVTGDRLRAALESAEPAVRRPLLAGDRS
jgi:benzoyl-CoA reductase/2-hydroxyglutaryl-CoA dehydratase subunit BcrC/BadD/HgdB